MRPIDADALLKSMEDSAQELRTIIDSLSDEVDKGIAKGQLISFLECKMRTREVPTLTLDDLCPKGRWVKKPWKMLGCVLRYDTVCSECGFDAPEFAAGGGSTVLTKFCHNCGAKMENGEANE